MVLILSLLYRQEHRGRNRLSKLPPIELVSGKVVNVPKAVWLLCPALNLIALNTMTGVCEQGKLPAIPVNKECCPPFQSYRDQAISPCSHPSPMVCLEGDSGWRKQEVICVLDPGPRELKCVSKE